MKYIVITILLANVFISVFLIFDNRVYSNEKDSYNKDELMYSEYLDNYRNQLGSEGYILKYSLAKYFSQNNKVLLIFRIPEYSCTQCVNRELLLIEKFINKVGKNSCLIVTGFSNERDFVVYKSNLSVDVPIVNINQLDIPADELEKPYYFMINKSSSIFNMFFPLKSSDFFSKKYFEGLRIYYDRIDSQN